MRVLVTGGSGNLASSLVRILLDDHAAEVEQVVALCRRPPLGAPGHTRLRWHAADLATDDLAPALDGVDAVVHTAWEIQPSHHPDRLWRTNVVGTRRLLEAMAHSATSVLVHASSLGAYSPPPPGRLVDESWPTDGIETLAYSQQKAYVERLLDEAARARPDWRVVSLRPGLLLKPEAAPRVRAQFVGPVVPRWIWHAWLARLVERLPTAFPVLHTDDAARAFALAVVDPTVRGPYNVAAADPIGGTPPAGAPLDNAVVRLAVRAAWQLRLVAAPVGWLDLVAACPLLDASRLRATGWAPRHDPHVVLASMLDAMRAVGPRTRPTAAPALDPWGGLHEVPALPYRFRAPALDTSGRARGLRRPQG